MGKYFYERKRFFLIKVNIKVNDFTIDGYIELLRIEESELVYFFIFFINLNWWFALIVEISKHTEMEKAAGQVTGFPS